MDSANAEKPSAGSGDVSPSASMAELKNVDVPLTQSAEALILTEPPLPEAPVQEPLPGMEQPIDDQDSENQSGKSDPGPEKDPGTKDYNERQRQNVEHSAQHRAEMFKHAQEKAKQENELRYSFFSVAIAMTCFVLLCSNFGVLVYIAQTNGAAHHVVLSAWLVSVVAEVVAIMHIIAKYLFPAPTGK